VHGANRLASNSLLDGLVFGRRVVEAIVAGKAEAAPTGAMNGVLDVGLEGEPEPDPLVLPHEERERVTDAADLRASVQRVMSAHCAVVRDAEGLRLASETLGDLWGIAENLPPRTIGTYEVCNVLRVSRAIVASAIARLESRGAHTRRDYPESSDMLRGRFVLRAGMVPAFVALGAVAVGEPS
jgi:L-aspartate oxidase